MNYLYIFIDISKLREPRFPYDPSYEGAIVGQLRCPMCNCLRQLYPRHRLASLRRRIVNNMSTALMRSHRDRMTLIGAEGDCALVRYEGAI